MDDQHKNLAKLEHFCSVDAVVPEFAIARDICFLYKFNLLSSASINSVVKLDDEGGAGNFSGAMGRMGLSHISLGWVGAKATNGQEQDHQVNVWFFQDR